MIVAFIIHQCTPVIVGSCCQALTDLKNDLLSSVFKPDLKNYRFSHLPGSFNPRRTGFDINDHHLSKELVKWTWGEPFYGNTQLSNINLLSMFLNNEWVFSSMFQDILWFCTVLRRQKTFTTTCWFLASDLHLWSEAELSESIWTRNDEAKRWRITQDKIFHILLFVSFEWFSSGLKW